MTYRAPSIKGCIKRLNFVTIKELKDMSYRDLHSLNAIISQLDEPIKNEINYRNAKKSILTMEDARNGSINHQT